MKILFQGDSITDAGRDRNVILPNKGLGTGYVNLLASRIGCDNPNVEVFNRGINGNRIADAYARWLEDMKNVDFDIFSALFGINDVGFQLRLNRGSDLERFEFIYDRMLFEVRQKAPDCKMILIAPFIFKMKDENNKCDIFYDWEAWVSRIKAEGEITEKLAKKYNAKFLPMLDIFEKAQKEIAGPSHWSLDCIHLSPAGNELLARSWFDMMKDNF